ncbi:hypothetical protein PAXINDRAFT_16351 [Paxillus involutus ATCC 200175]|uniref:Flavin reductase like domain-containing protein n=1 Tax=Paxillus involutus ATCC 200175 TaxID=664439 RepID=A0A0C9TJ15_PAXIN|nr:hypothetical protein PAXINDRAFT_16351 [Paxillus involutus ATCC 200175]
MSAELPPFDTSYRPKFTQPPNPGWGIGQGIHSTTDGNEWMQGEKKGWTVVETAKEEPMRLYQLMISGIVPRPIAFVSSVSETGIENIAPFSWFNMINFVPPMVNITCLNGPVRVHDTTNNVRATKQFTVNIISEPWVEQANITSIDAPESVSEWSLSGLTKAPSIHVKPARVKESAFSMECELFEAIDLIDPVTGKATSTMLLGYVKYIHIRNDMLTEKGVVDMTLFRPLSRMGDVTYARVGNGFRLARPVWEQEKDKVAALGLPTE